MNPTTVHRQTIFRPGTGVKRPATAAMAAILLAGWLGITSVAGAVSPGGEILEEKVESFSPAEYRAAVERLFVAFEEEREEPVRPGEKGAVGLKVYTGAGPGLATPLPLVRAVIESLVERGFASEKIFLVDRDERRLRKAGFLPDYWEGGREFEGHPVQALETGDFYDALWYYESPLPPRRGTAEIAFRQGEFSYLGNEEGRRSYLAAPLLLDVDFWINLPVYSDHPVLGVHGALVNATLCNASNTARFFHSETSGAAAVAEMAAIPELAEKWLFSIVSLERYQFVGGPEFRSLYTSSEPTVLLSGDPVALDSRMYRKMNDRRKERGFPELKAGFALIDYARQLKLGQPER